MDAIERYGIELARCAPFRIGDVTVSPPSREVTGLSGREVIEPRVMQVLVVLAEPSGRVVSRDELILRCWDGRAVGEDAINRVIGRLRRLSEGVAAGAFRIETITKVGYRLVASAPAEPPFMGARRPPAQPRPRAALAGPVLVRPVLVRRVLVRRVLAGVLLVAVAGALAVRVLGGASPPGSRPALSASQDLETRGISAIFEGTPEQTRQGLAYLKQAVALSPDDAEDWGSIAMSYAVALWITPEAEQADVQARVREAARKALLLDPREGHAEAALAALEPTFGAWGAKDATLLRAMRAARLDESGGPPDTLPLMFQRAQFLAYVGRESEAMRWTERMGRLAALIPWVQAARIDLLAAASRLDEAERVEARAGATWPRDRTVWRARFFFHAFHGRPDRALAMAAEAADRPADLDPTEVERARQAAQAIASGAPADADSAMAAYRASAPLDQATAEVAIRVAAALGRTDDAIAFARALYLTPVPRLSRSALIPLIGRAGPGERNMAPLFLPPADALWSDPRWMALMEEIDLAGYWRSAGAPDLCGRPAAAANCAAHGIGSPERPSGP